MFAVLTPILVAAASLESLPRSKKEKQMLLSVQFSYAKTCYVSKEGDCEDCNHVFANIAMRVEHISMRFCSRTCVFDVCFSMKFHSHVAIGEVQKYRHLIDFVKSFLFQ